MRLLLFNPSNDMALASDASEYMPPKRIQEMEAEYWRIPELIADEDDIVLSPDMMKGSFRDLAFAGSEKTVEMLNDFLKQIINVIDTEPTINIEEIAKNE